MPYFRSMLLHVLIMSPAHAHMHACTHGFGTCSNSGETIFAIIGWQPSTAMHGQEGAQSLLATCNTCTPGLSLFSYACCAHLCLPCVWARITCAANPHARIFLQNNSCLLPGTCCYGQDTSVSSFSTLSYCHAIRTRKSPSLLSWAPTVTYVA